MISCALKEAIGPKPMKLARSRLPRHFPGITLLELTVVICVILSLLSILFIGARAWKRGSDRAACVMNLRTVQWAMRSYQNLGGYDPGSRLYAFEEKQDLLELLNTKGFFSAEIYGIAKGQEACPGGGTCATLSTNSFPALGELFMTCSLAGGELHAPANHQDW